MIELRQLLNNYLKTLHSRVYFQNAPETALPPYIVYDIPTIYDDGELYQNITIDIDGWDIPSNGDTSTIETLMHNINTGLNKRILTGAGIAVIFYLENKLAIIDDDPKIKRRRYTYQCSLFERG